MHWKPYDGTSYLDFPAVEQWCHDTAEAYSSFVTIEEIGKSRHQRSIFLMTLSLEAETAHQRPAFWLDAGTHASERTGVMAALYSISQWMEGFQRRDPELLQWFSQHTVYVVPCISPDGYQALFEGYPYIRSTLRPPRTHDVREGFEPMDINGDGAIRLMRWKHPTGSFVKDPDLPMYMRPRKLADSAEDAYVVTVEGQFMQWDGTRWNACPRRYGIDLNRNFPAHWKPFQMFGMDSGDYSLSEPESRAVVDAFQARPNIAAAITHHTYTGCILTQPYRDDTPLSNNDIKLMEALAGDAVENTDYKVYRVYPDFAYDLKKPTVGVWSDTISTVFGVPGYTLELWDPYGAAGLSIEKPAAFFAHPDHDIIRKVIGHFSQFQELCSPWTEFEHPQLGTVEIGGLDYMRSIRNPPESLLQEECKKGHTVVSQASQALPRAHVSHHCEFLDNNTTKLTVVVENTGFLPTSGLQRSEDLGRIGEVTVQLTLPEGCSALTGAEQQTLGHLDGWGNVRVGPGQHFMHASLSPRGQQGSCQWVLQGSGSVNVHWKAGRAGEGSLTIQLPSSTNE